VPTILSQRWPATARSLAEARHATTDALTQTGVRDSKLLEAIALAVSEAVGNAIRHAYPATLGDVDLTVERHNDRITITVEDNGVGIDHDSDHAGLGLGLQLFATLTTTSTVDSDATGTTVTLGFSLNAEPQSPEHATDVHGDPETPI